MYHSPLPHSFANHTSDLVLAESKKTIVARLAGLLSTGRLGPNLCRAMLVMPKTSNLIAAIQSRG